MTVSRPLYPTIRNVLSLFLGSLLAVACGGGDTTGTTAVPVPTTMSLSSPSISMNRIEGTSVVTAVVRDAGGASLDGTTVIWSSSDASVATVDGSSTTAIVTSRGRGATVITARSGVAAATVTVLVRSAFSVAVSPSEILMRATTSLPLQAIVGADEGALTTVVWSSSAPSVASISAQGVVTGVSAGSALITARSVGDVRLSATASVTVTPPRAIVVSPAVMNIGRGEARALSAQVFIDPGTPTEVLWRSNRPLIATVNAQGVVTGVSDGNATITALAAADTMLRTTASVNVVPVIRSLTVTPATSALSIGQTLAISVAIVADQGVSQAVAWSSGDPAVASVGSTGVVTANAVGSTIIRVRAVADSTREATAIVSVSARPVELLLGRTTLGLTIGGSQTVQATVVADPGSSTAVEWTSRNGSIASVSTAGLVTGISGGVTWLIGEAVADRTKRDSIRITVVPLLADHWNTSRLGGPMIEDVVSLWAPSPALGFAVNSVGDVYRWNGQEWSASLRGSTVGTVFTAVHGSSTGIVTAVGTNGVIARFNGSAWATEPSGVTTVLRSVWMHSADSAWAVGANGIALRRTQNGWTVGNSATTATLRSVWGSGFQAYAVGDGGVIRRWEGGIWQALASGTTQTLNGVLGAANGPVFAVGEFGTIVRWNGSAFVSEPSATSATLSSISGNALGTMMVTGESVVITRVNGAWVNQSTPYQTRFSSGWIDTNGGLWIGGQRGLVMYADLQRAWSTLNLTPDLLDVWSSNRTHALAVGELGFIFAYNGTTWQRQAAPTLERLNSVWAASPGVAFAAGDNGVLLRWFNGRWEAQQSPTTSHVYALWGVAANAVWAVTDGGQILRYNGTSWSVVHTQSQPLYGVYGTSATDVHVVGLGGAALHFNGSSWRARTVSGSPVLVGLWAADSSTVVSVGARNFDAGIALRYNGSWQEISPGTTRILSAVWGAVGFDLYAVGDLGTVLRYNGVGWSPMTSGTSEFLWAVTGAPDATGAGFAVGLNGVLLQAQGEPQVSGARVGESRVSAASGLGSRDLAPGRGAVQARSATLPTSRSRRTRR